MDPYCTKHVVQAAEKWADDEGMLAPADVDAVINELPKSKKFRSWVPSLESVRAKMGQSPIGKEEFVIMMEEFFKTSDNEEIPLEKTEEESQLDILGLEEAKEELEINKQRIEQVLAKNRKAKEESRGNSVHNFTANDIEATQKNQDTNHATFPIEDNDQDLPFNNASMERFHAFATNEQQSDSVMQPDLEDESKSENSTLEAEEDKFLNEPLSDLVTKGKELENSKAGFTEGAGEQTLVTEEEDQSEEVSEPLENYVETVSNKSEENNKTENQIEKVTEEQNGPKTKEQLERHTDETNNEGNGSEFCQRQSESENEGGKGVESKKEENSEASNSMEPKKQNVVRHVLLKQERESKERSDIEERYEEKDRGREDDYLEQKDIGQTRDTFEQKESRESKDMSKPEEKSVSEEEILKQNFASKNKHNSTSSFLGELHSNIKLNHVKHQPRPKTCTTSSLECKLREKKSELHKTFATAEPNSNEEIKTLAAENKILKNMLAVSRLDLKKALIELEKSEVKAKALEDALRRYMMMTSST